LNIIKGQKKEKKKKVMPFKDPRVLGFNLLLKKRSSYGVENIISDPRLSQECWHDCQRGAMPGSSKGHLIPLQICLVSYTLESNQFDETLANTIKTKHPAKQRGREERTKEGGHHPSIHPFIHPFNSFIHPSIHSFIHSFFLSPTELASKLIH
jgi:hypothetical protein